MPHAIPPGPYCPPYVLGRKERGVIIGSMADVAIIELCLEHGISIGTRVPKLVWHLARTAACADLDREEKARCWDLARLELAEASERMRAIDPPMTEKS